MTISGYEGIVNVVETHVEVINMTGDVVLSENIRCGGDCSSYQMILNSKLVPGIYLINMKTNGARHSKRLMVK